jgi:hypothetical protein
MRVISAGTCLPSRCSETAVYLLAYFIATAVLVVCFETFVQQRFYMPQYLPLSHYVHVGFDDQSAACPTATGDKAAGILFSEENEVFFFLATS